MRRQVEHETLSKIYGLDAGDKIKVKDKIGTEIHEVVKVKRVNIETKYEGKSYNVPFALFDGIHEKVDLKAKAEERRKERAEKSKEFSQLKYGQLFWFNHKGYASILKFEQFKPGKIVGKNPVNNGIVTLDEGLYGGIVDLNYLNAQ